MREDSSRFKRNKYDGLHSALASSYGKLAGLRHFIGCSREEQNQRIKLLEELAKCVDAQKTWLYLEDYFALIKLSRRDFADESWWQSFVTSSNKKRLEELALQFLRQGISLPTELKGYANNPKLKKIVRNEKELSLTRDIESWFGETETSFLRVSPTDSFQVVCILSKLENSELYVPTLRFRIKRPKYSYLERTLEEIKEIVIRPSHEKEFFPEEDWHLLTWILELGKRGGKSEELDPFLCKKQDSKYEYLPSPRFFYQLLLEWGESGLLYLRSDLPSENSPKEYSVYYHNNFATTDIKIVRAQGHVKKGFSNLRSHLYFHLSTGKDIELSDAKILDGHPTFLLYENQFFLLKGLPNASLLSAHIQNPQLPLKSFNQSFILNLVRKNCRTEVPWSEVCISHKARPRLILELLGDTIQAKIEAISERDESIWFWNGQCWEFASNKKTEGERRKVNSKDVLEYLNDERLDTITEWFHRFDWFSLEKGIWKTEADINFLQKMAANWESKPFDAEYLGNPPIQRLFLNRQTLKPKVVVSSSGIDWLSVCAEWESEGLRLSRADLQRLCSAKGGYIKLPDAGWVELDEESVLETQEAMASFGIDDFSNTPQKVEMLHALHLSEQVLSSLTGNGLSRLRDSIKEFKGIPHITIPNGVRAILREYQQDGFNFLCWLAKMGVGGILADDMGLGKTLQTLAWLLWLKHEQKMEKEKTPSLVVCPASVVYNWKREVEKFTPELSTLILESGERKALFDKLTNYDLVVINYNLLRRDLEKLGKFCFRAVVLDEAQYIKNPSSQVAHAVKQLRACYRLALTGTPLENRLLDIWSITDFVQPGYLGSQQKFLQRYGGEGVIANHSESETQSPELDNAASLAKVKDEKQCEPDQSKKKEMASQERMSQLSARLRPILLRRLKSEVARDLPERIDLRCDCPLFEDQRKLYLAELRRSRELINESVEKVGLNKSKIHVLAALMRLRQICCHPSLVGSDIMSGKTEALFDLLETLHSEGQKVLVFSQFVEMLNILQTECEQRGYKTYILTGATKKREEVVNAFQKCEDPAIFLLSLRAAGTGLNLTAASYVVLYDPWWNPAVESQAIDRTHRIGQVKSVHAYRLIAPGTVEEKIWELQQIKSSTIDQVLGDRDFTKKITQEELQYLFSE